MVLGVKRINRLIKEHRKLLLIFAMAGAYAFVLSALKLSLIHIYLKELLKEYGAEDGLVLDLGCGTGSMTQLLAEAGYDMIGADNSEEMLEIAMEKRAAAGLDILYLLQDMREFELYGTVRAVVSICDSMNYIMEPEELTQVFRLANNYLDPGGVFIFDLNTEYKYKELMGENTFAEDLSLIHIYPFTSF